jgi:hypothetical protein
MAVRVEGLEKILSNLSRKIDRIEKRSKEGLLAAGLMIQAEAQKMTPVDDGFLKASAYTRRTPENKSIVEIGFSQNYALYVHEDLEAHHTVGEAKFLEKAIRENRAGALHIIRQAAIE